MSDKIIPPWEQGKNYVEPPVQNNADRMKEMGRRGGEATARNNKLRAKGFTVKSASRLAEERIKRPGKKGPRAPDPNSVTSIRLSKKTEENLTPNMRIFAATFCREYIKDFNVANAYLRAGGSPNAMTRAYEMMRWPFVQQELDRLKEILEEEVMVTKKDVLLGLKREANDFSESASHSARVSAWGKLGRVLKMDVTVTQSETTVTHRGGVMVVPAPQSVDQWENVTADVQRKLKEDVTK